MAGESASRLGHYPDAIRFYDAVPSSDPRQAAVARWAAGEVHLQIRQMSLAIEKFEASLQLDPEHAGARQRLVYLLNLLGRRWEAALHLTELVRRDQWSIQHLLYLGNLAKPIENEAELQLFLRATPDDRLPELGLARIRLREGRWDEAGRYLQHVLQQQPALLEAHVQQGGLWLQQAPDQLPAWHASLPDGADNHPGIWMVRGQWARTNSQPEAAARCYAEALRLDPDHLAALNALAQVLHERGQNESATPLRQRAEELNQLVLALEQIMSDEWSIRQAMPRPGQPPEPQLASFIQSPKRLQPILTAARQTRRLGRDGEADAWTRYAQAIAESKPALVHSATNDQPPGPALDLAWAASRKLPNWPSSPTMQYESPVDAVSATVAPASLATAATAQFETIAGALDFQFFNARTDFEDGRRMFEMTGGGIGVLDYDRDGWPDVFLAQGCTWPADGTDAEHCDQLRRNLGNAATNRSGESSDVRGSHQGFLNVTTAAGIAEAAFGQGVAIGDVNSDGFDDIYVCNVGVNQLWINRGDGTFGNAAARFKKPSTAWTSSAAIADLNGDGTAEIYDANYVEGQDVFSRRCVQGGKPRTCSPLNFQPAEGRLMTICEDGLYHDVGNQTLDSTVHEGNALGVIVMRLPGQSLPALFIANDQVANLMLIARPDADAPLGIRLGDEAVLRGLAYDAQGNAQACMGVAADDLNGDGSLDLFVTNYYDESNTLYLQHGHGNFHDATGVSGLVAPSLKMLGFGVQALDAQLDGRPDLVVLNGHIDDMTHMQRPFAMPGQFFQGAGQGRFREATGDRAGSYFETPRLGRALATLDVDRDGRPDLIAAELDGPTELLHNTSAADQYLCLQLAGVSSHRDAIGCEVVATIGDKTMTKQLTAGCGYMVSNQKQLWFGCGPAPIVDQLVIHWPSGRTQTHRNLPTNSHWLAVENQSQLTALPLP